MLQKIIGRVMWWLHRSIQKQDIGRHCSAYEERAAELVTVPSRDGISKLDRYIKTLLKKRWLIQRSKAV